MCKKYGFSLSFLSLSFFVSFLLLFSQTLFAKEPYDTTKILPPIMPKEKTRNIRFTSDFLYWSTSAKGMFYTPKENVKEPLQESFANRMEKIDSPWNVGFRAGVEYPIQDFTEIHAGWTSFRSQIKNKNSQNLQREGKWSSQISIYDADVGRKFLFSSFSIKPSLGLCVFLLQQESSMNFQKGFFQKSLLENSYKSGGAFGKIHMEYDLSSSWHLFSRTSSGLFYGIQQASYTTETSEENLFGSEENLQTFQRFFEKSFSTQISLGGRWNIHFYKNKQMGFSAAWEQNLFWNVPQLEENLSKIEQDALVQKEKKLAFQGVSLQAYVDF
jgi:hypothetical protein